jgi:nucleotide sugar dehydrogenase
MSRVTMLKEKDLDTPEKRGKYVVTVVGCGRMGLPAACLFAEAGFKVIGLDTDPSVVNQINKGLSPFSESGLSRLIKKNLKEGRLAATTEIKEAVPKSDIIIVSVHIPVDQKKRSDYSQFKETCRDVGLNLKMGTLLIFESPVGPGSTETLIEKTLEAASGQKTGVDFGLVYSPIRASIGRVLRDMRNNARVIAAADRQSLATAKAVLKAVTRGEILETSNIKTAETIGLFEHVYRDVNLALANEFAGFCEKMGIDYIEAQTAANTHQFCHLLEPGIASEYVSEEPHLLIEEAENVGAKLQITALARRINDEAVKHSFSLIRDALRSCGKTVNRAKVTVMGVSFRPNVKETRGTLVMELVKTLQRKGAKVNVFDPFFSYSELKSLGFPAERTLSKTVEGTDCLVVAVGHDRFKRLKLGKFKVLMKKPAVIVDLSHAVNPYAAEKEGFTYRGLGRGIWSK